MNPEELLSRVETLAQSLRGSAQAAALVALDQLAEELPALCNSVRNDPVLAHRTLSALARYWWLRGRAPEGLVFAKQTLALPCDDRSLRAPALEGAAALAYARSEFSLAHSWWEHSLELYTQLANEVAVGRVANQLGQVAREQGNYALASQRHQQALTIAQQHNDTNAVALALSNLGVVSLASGKLSEATTFHEQALALRTQRNDAHGQASSLGNLAIIDRIEHRFALARERLETALTLRRSLGDTWGVCAALVALAVVHLEEGKVTEAKPLLREGTIGVLQIGDGLGLAESLEACALSALKNQQTALAARCLGAAIHQRKQLGAPLPWHRKREQEQLTQSLQPALGEAFETWLAHGATETHAALFDAVLGA